MGSDRGSLSQSECSSPSLASPPHSPLNLETSSFASSQSQNSIASLPRISISTVPMGERRKDSHYYFLPHFSSSRYVFRTRSLLRLPAHSRPRFSSVRCLRSASCLTSDSLLPLPLALWHAAMWLCCPHPCTWCLCRGGGYMAVADGSCNCSLCTFCSFCMFVHEMILRCLVKGENVVM
ncbi:hypothetical protein GDO81_004591 [Engystomops pustulosus]|uniref:Uncharacterized protein n=1 Tax=Engystomops pustulosus TaxID=76066 RepID=A0AAV6ZZ87_ENGPU|nr:hypothetical protein GDO81_004591 [Engystomops pustulosus]